MNQSFAHCRKLLGATLVALLAAGNLVAEDGGITGNHAASYGPQFADPSLEISPEDALHRNAPSSEAPINGAVPGVSAIVSADRGTYILSHFGQDAVVRLQAVDSRPTATLISNDHYAPVAPPSPLLPLGGENPLGSWAEWGSARPASHAEPGTSQGTGWYANSSSTYHGDPFAGKSSFGSWLWKHHTAQYMWENFCVFGGAQGFKGPLDLGQNGNYGFHEGINWGMPVWDEWGFGYQKGFQVVHSDLAGGNGLVNHGRTQYFVTAGLFHRPVRGVGLQYGVALDDLSDSFYVDVNLAQIRGEISFVGPWRNEVGFRGASHVGSDSGISPLTGLRTSYQATDYYALFLRRQFTDGGNAGLWSGWTDGGDGLLGGDAMVYINERWAVQGAFNYKIPKDSSPENDSLREDIALAFNLVWWPGYRTPCSPFNPYQQLFNVADNTTLLINTK